MEEQLLILDDGRSDEKTRQALGRVRKSQEFSERVFVVQGDHGSIEALRALPGILTPAQLSPGASEALSPTEKLSIDAWQSRASDEPKARPGDGLSWGHKDFQAPR